MKYLFVMLFLLFPLAGHAEIYKTVDANGDITYTDKPTSDNAVPVTIPKGNTSPATSSPTTNTNPQETPPASVNATSQDTKKPYVNFEISSPANQDSIQNQPTLIVKLNVDPSLQDGDVIQVYVDGGPIGNALHQTSFDLPIPYRGTHILSATLFDKNMQMLKRSNGITIYVHQAHLGGAS